MSTRLPPRDSSLSLWHGLAADWHDRVAQQIRDRAQTLAAFNASLSKDMATTLRQANDGATQAD